MWQVGAPKFTTTQELQCSLAWHAEQHFSGEAFDSVWMSGKNVPNDVELSTLQVAGVGWTMDCCEDSATSASNPHMPSSIVRRRPLLPVYIPRARRRSLVAAAAGGRGVARGACYYYNVVYAMRCVARHRSAREQ